MAGFRQIDALINLGDFRSRALRRPGLSAAGQIDLGVPVGDYHPHRSKSGGGEKTEAKKGGKKRGGQQLSGAPERAERGKRDRR